jgi:DNA-binding MarR family transcriptional regulator
MKSEKAIAQATQAACVCSSIRQAARAITQLYDEALRPSGLRITQFSILGATLAAGPITLTQLAEATVTDRTTLARNLKLLEEQGLIRIAIGDDRREREISITRRGGEALKNAHPLWQKAQAKVIKSVGPEEVKVMREKVAAVTVLLHKT